MPHECLAIIESKSKVHYSRNKPVLAKVSKNASASGISPYVAELKDMVKALLLVKKSQNQAPATVKVVEESYGNNLNRGPVYQPSVFQPPAYQAPAYQAPAPQTQGVSKDDFSAYIKANDVVMRNMQTQGQNMPNQLTNMIELFTKFMNSNSASTLSSGTLPSNTIANPRSDLKAITTRSGVSYDRPQIPPPPIFLPKVVENTPEATKDMITPPNNRNCKIRSSVTKQTTNVKDLNFNISFVDALILMPKFDPSIKSLLTNTDKLCKLAKTPLNEHCSTVLLKKLLEKLGDPGKFLIPCDFPRMAECLALADLGASINLMPLTVWNKLALPDLSPTCMTLELADHSISRPVGVAEDVYVKVGKLTLRVGKEAITFNLDQTSRYSANYSDMTAKRIDVVDMACEEYSQEVLSFSDVIASSNLTPNYDPIISTTSSTSTPFKNSDFLLEEVDAFLALEEDLTSPKVDESYLDSEGDILLLEAFLNDDPSLPPPNQGNYLPEVRKELKICEAKSNKSLIDEPLEVELKDLPPHLEYAFLEGGDKLPFSIAKDLSMEENTALITVLKSHKRAIAWKLSDIKVIDPEFCTHKILKKEDFEPAVQHQRRVNPKIHDVIKQEGGFTVVENEENELILTRLVTGWRVCIDCRKLNEATRNDHFSLPFMDQMLKRLAGNQNYCFLNGFSGYFQILIDPKDQGKPHSPAHTERLLTATYLLGYAINQVRFREKMLKMCEDTSLCLNWEKSHFMVKEGIVLGHKNSKEGIEVDKAKVDVITKLPHPTTVKECVEAFQTLKRKLIEAPILIAPDSDMPFELMCDASDFAIGAVLGQRQEKHSRPIHYASDHRKVQLNELRDQAFKNSLIYKEKTKRLHDSKIKDNLFNIGDRVLLFNSRLKIFSGKMKSHWSGPFTISHVFPYGTVALSQPDGPNFKVNGHRLKHYFGEDIPKMVVPDLQTFPKDH
nr:hypothetical protein [Tanacetum cinerariifolium]